MSVGGVGSIFFQLCVVEWREKRSRGGVPDISLLDS
jgi:hypothetical protein